MALINPAQTIPNKSSKSEEWSAWYSELKKRYGKKNANVIFTKAWSKRGSDAALSNDLDTLLKSNGVSLQRGLVASIEESAYTIVDKVEGIFGVGKYILLGGGILIGVPVLIFLVQIARKPERVGAIAGAALRATPEGAVAGAVSKVV